MFLSDFAIRRPIVTVVTMIALVMFGVVALKSLQVDEYPDISAPVVFVAVPYPGASPEQVEREVVDRMEEAFGSISGIDQIDSKATDGFASIIVQFVVDRDPDQAMQDVRDALSGVQDLPPEMEPPLLQKFDPDQIPIVSLVLRAPGLSTADLTSIADPGLARELRAIPGVAQVAVAGGVPREIGIQLRPAELRA